MSDIISYALSYKGKVKYVFGADDVEHGKGDCSSFTKFIYGQYGGVTLARDTSGQLAQGKETDNPRVGDLVFFQNTYRNGVSHVGIYSGNRKFVHLSSGVGTVTESSLDTQYYAEHFLGYRTFDKLDLTGTKNDAFHNASDAIADIPSNIVNTATSWVTKAVSSALIFTSVLGLFLLGFFFLFKAIDS